MVDKTLYDILEVSPSASTDIIEAAYGRLSQKYDPARPENHGDPSYRIQYDALREAFTTLSDPERRAQYDTRIASRTPPPLRNVQLVEPFWTLPKLALLGLIVLVAGGFYFKHAREQGRLASETAIAEAKAKAEIEKARAEEEQARIEAAREQQERATEAQQRREREMALRQLEADQRAQTSQNRRDAFSNRRDQLSEEQRRRNEEISAAAAARQQLARDKAELCRMERERYGRAISC